MKKGTTLLMALGLMMAGSVSAKADIVNNYSVDFSEPISTSAHNFKVADGWGHIVDIFSSVDKDNDPYDYYVEYSYDATNGLNCGNQKIGPFWSISEQKDVYDLLVTPEVSGEVTLSVKQTNYNGYVEFYTISGNQKGEIIGKQHKSDLSDSEFTTLTLTIDTPQKIGIRASRVYINGFTAEQADVQLNKTMKVVSATSNGAVSDNSNGGTGGQIKWPADPTHKNANGNNMIKVSYMVTVQNNCNATLTAGDENYTVSIINSKLAEPIATVAVPQTLAPGEISEPFEVTGWVNPYVDYNTSKDYPTPWSYSNDSQPFNVRENLDGTVLNLANGGYVPYDHKIVFRQSGTTSTAAFNANSPVAIAFGLISTAATVNYEIYNDGVAPLEISAISISEPFSVSTSEATTVNKGETLPLAIEFPATATGSNTGDLTLTFTDNDGVEKTVVLAKVSGTMLAEGTWSTAFGDKSSSATQFPEGSVAEYSISTNEYEGTYGNYNPYIRSTSSSSNKFYTPLLHANAGDSMSFSTKRYSTTHSLKVYVTTDRAQLGEPVETINNLTSSWEMKSVTIPDEGDFYVVFELYNVYLDDVVGLTKVDVAHDLFIKDLGSYSATDYQSGDNVSKEINVIAPLSATADDYTVEMVLGDEVVATIESKALTAHAKNSVRFSGSFTKNFDATTTLPFFWRFTFANGGPVITSEPLNLTFQCEPKFCFVSPNEHGNNYNPPTSKTSHNFGKVNTTNLTADYEIFNWGKAVLNVKSITVPEGFSVNVEAPLTIGAREGTPLTITFSATEIGIYGGDIVITFVNAEGEDEEFKFAVSGTLLDPTKFYASFDGSGAVAFPAGSVYDRNISSTNAGNYSAPNYVIYSSSATDNMFVTPLLHANAGETFTFDAKLYSASWSEGTISVYAAATRADLYDKENGKRTLLTQVKGKDIEDETKLMTTDFKTFTTTVDEAGDYYIGYELSGRAYLDEIYGLSPVEVAHDIDLVSFAAPATAMQNNLATATLQVRNFGFAAEEAGSYSAIVSVNGVETVVTDVPAIPTMLKSNETPVSISVPFRYSKVGTFPVSVKLQFGDYTIETEPADVEFTEEVFSTEKQVGEFKELSTVPFHTNYKLIETVALYTPEMLGLKDGDQVASISLRGYFNVAHESDVVIAYAWVDETTLSKPEQNSKFDTSSMNVAFNEESFNWPGGGNKNDIQDLFTININEPYADGKSLMLMFGSYTTGKYNLAAYSELSTSTGNCWYRQNDNSLTNAYWGAKNLPVLHIALAAEAKTMSGTVVGPDNAPVEGAEVTLSAADGSGVEYSGTTAADGTYEINVIQSNRTYNVTVTANGLEATAQGVTFAQSVVMDFTLSTPAPVVHIHPEANGIESVENARVHFNLDLTPGYHALAMPFAIDHDKAAAIFGNDAEIYTLVGTTLEDGALFTFFETATAVAAGEPFLVKVTETTDVVLDGITVVAEPIVGGESSSHVTFSASYQPTEGTGKFTFSDADFVQLPEEETEVARYVRANGPAADVVPAFHATVQARPGKQIDSMNFAVNQTPTGIKEITVKFPEGKAYDLRGMRSLNPANGIYIINGKKVLVK